jgi:hypothetical protein
VHAEPSHWLCEISISKTVHHHFLAWANTPHYNKPPIGGTYLFIYLLWSSLFSASLSQLVKTNTNEQKVGEKKNQMCQVVGQEEWAKFV